jgi:peptidoglycan/LPS O-acetylase OafA/YrhL
MHDERQPSFRADVQGLRALAVLTVIAAHAGVPFLPGGYVGVDVFFVVSGFLISQLLFREVELGGVSIGNFYARRARRILPAATVVTLATVIASLVWLSVVDALEVVTDALWATFFAANLRFSAVGTDYFAQEQAPSPLQHYWSLAVEEQFYLFWPLILIGCVWLTRRRRRGTGGGGRPLPRLAIFWALTGLGLASFAYGVVLASTNPVAAYFSTPARAWEFAVGAVTALVARRVAGRLDPDQRGAAAATGLLAIAFACLFYGEGTATPLWAAAVPVVGTALVLLAGAAGQPSQLLPLRLLSVRPMQRIGDWSYSLYLWHLPLLVIPEIRAGGQPGAPVRVLMVALAFVLAWLTYRFVETPFRRPMRWPRRRALALYPATAGLVVASCVAASTYGHWKVGEFGDRPAITLSNSGVAEAAEPVAEEPITALVQASVAAARNGMAIPSDLTPDLLSLRDDVPGVGDCDYGEDVRLLCPRGDTGADRTIVVFGNSHARMWIPAFERIAEREGYLAYYLVKPNCAASLVEVGDQRAGFEPWTACTEFREWALDRVAELEPDLVAVSSSPPNRVVYDDGTAVHRGRPEYDELVRAGYQELFSRLERTADRTVLIRDVPRHEGDPGPCLTTDSPDLGDCLSTPDPALEAYSDLPVEVARQAGIEWIDPTKWVCWRDRCPAVIGDLLPYRDRGHLSAAYAGTLADELGSELGMWSE